MSLILESIVETILTLKSNVSNPVAYLIGGMRGIVLRCSVTEGRTATSSVVVTSSATTNMTTMRRPTTPLVMQCSRAVISRYFFSGNVSFSIMRNMSFMNEEQLI